MPLVNSLINRVIQRLSHGALARVTSGRNYTNLCLQSENLSTTWANVWGGARAITANEAVAPNGTTTADLQVSDGGSSASGQSVAMISGQTYTFSIYAKRKLGGTEDTVTVLQIRDGIGGDANILKSSGNIALPASGAYVRSSLTWLATSTATFVIGMLTPAPGTSGIYFWGAQLETGPVTSTYIPTTTVAVTREEP